MVRINVKGLLISSLSQNTWIFLASEEMRAECVCVSWHVHIYELVYWIKLVEDVVDFCVY